MTEWAGLLAGFILTLFIYSYLAGDNVLYRIAVHILLGVTSAYAAVIVTQTLFVPIYQQIAADPTSRDSLIWMVPLILAVLLALKFVRPVAWLGNGAVAALIGVGSAVGLVGAISGTLLPQLFAPAGSSVLITVVAAALTICTLLYFQFTGRVDDRGQLVSAPWQRVISLVGRAVLMITLGALFAGLLSTSLVLLIDRISYFLRGFLSLIGAWPT